MRLENIGPEYGGPSLRHELNEKPLNLKRFNGFLFFAPQIDHQVTFTTR